MQLNEPVFECVIAIETTDGIQKEIGRYKSIREAIAANKGKQNVKLVGQRNGREYDLAFSTWQLNN